MFRAGAGFAYSPNVSNTGAWSKYAAFVWASTYRQCAAAGHLMSVTGGAGYFGSATSRLGWAAFRCLLCQLECGNHS